MIRAVSRSISPRIIRGLALVLGVLLGSEAWGQGDGGARELDAKRDAGRLIVDEQPDAALELLAPLLERHPEDPELNILTGEAHYARDDLEQAVRFFEKGLAHEPAYRDRVFNLGRAYQQLNRLDDAARVFGWICEGSTAELRSKGFFGRGLVLEERGDEKLAREAFEQSVRIDPQSYRPHYRLGVIALDDEELEKAVSEFRFVLGQRPLHHGAAYNLGLALGRLGQQDAAVAATGRWQNIMEGKKKISVLTDRLHREGPSANILVELGEIHRALEDWSAAARWYQRARQLAPQLPAPHLGLAASLVGLDRGAQAEQIYASLLRWNPPVREAALPLIRLLEARGDQSGADRLRKAYGLDP